MSTRPPRDDAQSANEDVRRARARRDAGLRKASRLTGWALMGTLGLTGAVSEVAAHARPGHKKPVSATTATRPAPATTSEPQKQQQAPEVIQSPAETPVPSDSGAGAVSGGS